MQRRRALVIALVVSSAVAGSVIGAAPSQAASGRTLSSVHVSLSAVTGSLPAGAGITVIETCPKGSDLDRGFTSEIGELHDPHVTVASREYWPAGVVTRYRVTTRLSGVADFVLAAGAAICRIHVPAGARTVSGQASTDVRIWGPAPSRVDLFNVTVMGVVDSASPEQLVRTTVRGAGVGSSRGSLRHAVSAVQQSLNSQVGVGGVVAIGSTTRAVPRGSFASMENRYGFRLQL